MNETFNDLKKLKNSVRVCQDDVLVNTYYTYIRRLKWRLLFTK